MGRASARVDVDGLVCVLYVCEESAVSEHVYRAMVVKKDTVWIEASRVVVHVVRYLAKARAWRGLVVVVMFVVRLGVVLIIFYLDTKYGSRQGRVPRGTIQRSTWNYTDKVREPLGPLVNSGQPTNQLLSLLSQGLG